MQKEEDFATLFEKSLTGALPEEGDIVTGRVVQVTRDLAIIDFGHKQEGQVALSEFRGPTGEVTLQVGDQVEVYIENLENEEGLAILSKEKALALKIWDHLQEAMDKEGTVDGTVVEKVKGGLSVDIGVKAFLPASQVDLKGSSNFDRLIGKKLKFKILKLNKRKGNIIVSRRALMERGRDFARQEALQGLSEGQTIAGQVKNLTDYGAFIDLGGIDGLLHITDISWGRLGHPSEVLHVGQEVNVKILKLDPESGKVSLGLKQLTQDPWGKVPEKYPVGSKTKGRVVNVTDYGAFVELEEGIEGLLHISEMSWSRKVKHPSKLVSVGDFVETAVLDLDPEARRISLGMKQLVENPWEKIWKEYPVGTKVTGPVKNVTDFGIFVGLSPDVDGLVHVSDLFWIRPVRPIGELYPKGKMVEAIVLRIEKETERLSLGVKQLSEDPWVQVKKKYAVGTRHEGKVCWVGERGAAVELEEAIEGLWVPAGDLKAGQTVDVIIQALEERDRKILVGGQKGTK